MAGLLYGATRVLCLVLVSASLVSCGSVKKPVQNVPEPVIQSALNSLNEDSPTHHTYKGGNLISAQKLVELPYVVYRLTFDLTPICIEALEPCPREACTVEVKQHEAGDIKVLKDSIQCMYLFPQSVQDEQLQMQENQDQELIENLDKQIVSNQSVELDHEIQKNGDHNDRPFIAMRASNSNYCPGCPYELNPNLPGLLAFEVMILKSMDELTQTEYKHKVIDIVKVTRTVPPSSNAIQYQILLYVGESDCLKNAIDQSDCSVQVDRPIKTCLVTFEEQPWQESSRRIVRNNCTMDEPPQVRENYDSTLQTAALVTPAPEKQEQNSEKLDALESLKDILDTYTHSTTEKSREPEQAEVTEHPIVKVSLNRSNDDVGTRGFEDKVKEFSEFLTDFDLPIKEGQPNSDANREGVKEEIIVPRKVDSAADRSRSLRRIRRKSDFLGAAKNVNVNDSTIVELASKGLRKFSENSEGRNEPMIVEIVEATQQVVSGYLYKIRVKLGTSDCPKGTSNSCQLKEGSQVKECLFTIWSQPWVDKGSPEITINCDLSNRRRRSLRGSQYNQKMLKLAKEIKDGALFDEFVKEFGRTYSSGKEKQYRFKIFQQNLKLIEELQTLERGSAEYGVTMFADLTPKEFKSKYLGLRRDLKQENDIPLSQATIPNVTLPAKFDWRDQGVVTPVKNQGQCGSCWAFSVTGNVEGQYAIKHKQLLSLSEQELVDCDTLDEGCNGGYMENAYKAIEKLGGLELETDYPYDAKNEKCHFLQKKARVQVVSAVNITTDETKIAQWLVKNGPISVGINANAMQFYVGGVSHPFKFLCDPENLDHGVLIVGYGTSKYPLFHKELPYWVIKNSWGPRWGERGYYRVYRGDGTCGVNTMASSAIVA